MYKDKSFYGNKKFIIGNLVIPRKTVYTLNFVYNGFSEKLFIFEKPGN